MTGSVQRWRDSRISRRTFNLYETTEPYVAVRTEIPYGPVLDALKWRTRTTYCPTARFCTSNDRFPGPLSSSSAIRRVSLSGPKRLTYVSVGPVVSMAYRPAVVTRNE